MKRILFSPVTHFNLIVVGFLALIQGFHLHAHHAMELDVDSYVRNFCRKNTEKCARFLKDY
jgi:hypothetical protein